MDTAMSGGIRLREPEDPITQRSGDTLVMVLGARPDAQEEALQAAVKLADTLDASEHLVLIDIGEACVRCIHRSHFKGWLA